MNQKQFVNALKDNYKSAIDIVEVKNHDYASVSDPFRNFRFAEYLNLGVDKAILVRMSDKLARISNLLDQESKVKDESIGDTLLDLANYAMILKVYLEENDTK